MKADFAIIGSGPAGHHAALEAAKAGCSVVLIERERDIGGACVHRGTIPSKTLRATAVQLAANRRGPESLRIELDENAEVASLMTRLHDVVDAHVGYMRKQAVAAGIRPLHGRARFVGPTRLEVAHLRGQPSIVEARHVVVATGSRPRRPPEIPIDHENVLDSDSILSLAYLPQSLIVLGGGVIASEWASIFASLGVAVTMIDRGQRPLAFMDEALTAQFVSAFEATGSRYLAGREIRRVAFDGIDHVDVVLGDGACVRARKVLCALGRTANVAGLGLEAAGIQLSERGHIPVDEHGRAAERVYAVGDVIGFPALAATSMVQGRRAVRHALGLGEGQGVETIPIGIFTIPEMASVGASIAEASQRPGGAVVGEARFSEVARGHISAHPEGKLMLVASGDGRRLLGAHIVGEGATELIHLAQLALIGDLPLSTFVDNAFNFPTMAEAYRIAALAIADEVERRAAA